jgi:DNA polymerase elongation subunit (family B)
VMKREAIADRAIWTAKKHYILNVLNNEGVQYAEPKIKMMGIEAVKSSTPEICRDEMGNMFKLIMSGTEEDVKKALSEFRSKFMAMPVDEISFPRGISDIEKWMPRNKKQIDEPSLFDEQVISNRIYEKGTPIHVRGALLYNNLVRKNRLTKKYPLIREGDKIKFVYLAEPNPIHENVISFPESLPKEFKLDNFVDREVQFEKTFLDPLDPIFKAIRMNPTKEVTLEQFFS